MSIEQSLRKILAPFDESSSNNLSLEEISNDLSLLAKITSQNELTENQQLYTNIYNWCLQHAKRIVKLKLGGKVQEIIEASNNNTQRLEKIHIKMNKQLSVNHKCELDNQDLSFGITLERQKCTLMRNKEEIEKIDTLTDFHQVVTLLKYL
jgi:hypothetical protein